MLFDAIGQCDEWLENGALENLRRESRFDYIRFEAEHGNITRLIGRLPKYSDTAGFEQQDQDAIARIKEELDSRPVSKFENMENVHNAMSEFDRRQTQKVPDE